jgi:hypothetical protein
MNSTEFIVNMNINRMFLCRYSDLSDEAILKFNTDDSFNIYMILKGKKIIVNPEKSYLKKDGELALSFEVHSKGEIENKIQKLEYRGPIENGKIESEYPFKKFKIKDGEKIISGGHISSFLRSIRSKVTSRDEGLNPTDGFDFLDLDLLYVGQAKGRKKKSTALNRLVNHSTYQKILALEQENDPDSEIWIGLCNFELHTQLMITPKSMNINNQKGNPKPTETFKNLLTEDFQHEAINIAEAALIKFFVPKYNSDFTDSFPSPHHSSYNYFYKNNIHSIMVEFFPYENIASRISTDRRQNYSIGFITFQLTGESAKIGPIHFPSHNE